MQVQILNSISTVNHSGGEGKLQREERDIIVCSFLVAIAMVMAQQAISNTPGEVIVKFVYHLSLTFAPFTSTPTLPL